MSTDPRHLGITLRRLGTVDTADRRGRGEGRAVVLLEACLAGHGLIPGMIVLVALLGLMGGQAAAHRGDVDRRDDLASSPSSNPPLAPTPDIEARRNQNVTPDVPLPSLFGTKTIVPCGLIDVYRDGTRPDDCPSHSPTCDNQTSTLAIRRVSS